MALCAGGGGRAIASMEAAVMEAALRAGLTIPVCEVDVDDAW